MTDTVYVVMATLPDKDYEVYPFSCSDNEARAHLCVEHQKMRCEILFNAREQFAQAEGFVDEDIAIEEMAMSYNLRVGGYAPLIWNVVPIPMASSENGQPL